MKGDSRRTIIAAGALVWRVREDSLQVLAVHRPRYDDWSWPKGKTRRGETLPECAIREVFEETGKQVMLGQVLPSVSYTLQNGHAKRVTYWSAETTNTAHPALLARPRYRLAPKREIDNTRWFTVEQARKMITMPSDLKVLDTLVKAYESGRLRTRAFILTRHARARKRSGWRHDDLARPLTVGGARRAHQLIRLFSAFGIRAIHSSPAARCLMTVQPYSTTIGKKISTHDSLTEAAHEEDPKVAAETFMELLASERNSVVCAHRPTMPTLLTMLEAATRKWTRGRLPRKNPYLPAGGVLVAHVMDTESGPRITALERHLLI
ncbi:MAG: NUDIX hydrolase [Demequinaceae bacterium]|nr:NUDIX hydrolase [Demequinaceae bacterium]